MEQFSPAMNPKAGHSRYERMEQVLEAVRRQDHGRHCNNCRHTAYSNSAHDVKCGPVSGDANSRQSAPSRRLDSLRSRPGRSCFHNKRWNGNVHHAQTAKARPSRRRQARTGLPEETPPCKTRIFNAGQKPGLLLRHDAFGVRCFESSIQDAALNKK